MSIIPTYEELEQRIKELEQAANRQQGVINTFSNGENQYQSLIQKIQAAVVVHDADTKIVNCNSKAKEFLGLSDAQILGKEALDPGWKFIRSDKTEMPVDEYPVNQVLATKTLLTGFVCGLRHPLRTELSWMLVDAAPILDDKGNIKQVIVTYNDITERKQAQDIICEQATTLHNILHKAADGICVCHNIPEEPYVRFTHWNPRMTDITGFTIDEINKLGWYQTVYPDPEIRKKAVEKMNRMREGEDLLSEEWMITTKFGEEKHLSISTSIISKNEGEVHVLAIMKDVTEHRKAEEELRESRKKYQNIIEKSDDVIWTTDLDIKTTYVSPSIERKLGFTPEERMGQSLEEQMPPSSYKAVMECLAQELEKENDENVDPNRIIRIEVEYYHKNGSTLWFEVVASGLRDKNGVITGIHGISRDITDKIMAEKALRESEEKHRLLTENSTDIIYKIDLDSEQYSYASPSAEKLFGYTNKEILGLKAGDSVTPESYAYQREKLEEAILQGKNEPETMELFVLHKNGRVIPIEVNARILFDKQGIPTEIFGIARDITWRKEAEWALRESENKFRSLVELTSDWIWEVDNDGNYTYVSPKCETLLGYKPFDLIGKTKPFHLMPKDEAERVGGLFRAIVAARESFYGLENINTHKDGHQVVLETSGVPFFDEAGDLLGYRGIDREITERKQSEEKLQKSEERYKFLAENVADIVFTFDMGLNVTYVSPSIKKVLGFTPEERKQQTLEEMVTPDSLERLTATFVAEIEHDNQAGLDPDRTVVIETENYHKTGSTVWLENIVKAIRNKKGHMIGIYGAARNITNRKSIENSLKCEKKRLEKAITEIKKLSGLLPICSSCKKIRDDKGYWNQIETYIRDRSEAEFSHGICPDCMKKLYPNFINKDS